MKPSRTYGEPGRIGWCATEGMLGALAWLVGGCASVFLQTDGFGSKLERGCSTEDECTALVSEASKRVDTCKPNTIGSVRCDDAAKDLEEAKTMLARVQSSAKGNEQRSGSGSSGKEWSDSRTTDAAACEKGDGAACKRAADSYDADGLSSSAESYRSRAKPLLLKSCESDDAAACFELSSLLSGQAREGALTRACNLRNDAACQLIATASDAQQVGNDIQQADAAEEIKTGRCTQAHAQALQQALTLAQQAVGQEYVVTDHRTVVATPKGTAVGLTPGLAGEYHVLVGQPGRNRRFGVTVLDADGYEAGTRSPWGGVLALPAGPPMTSSGRVVRWPASLEQVQATVVGQGCALVVLAYRVDS